MAGSKSRNIPTPVYRGLLARSGNKCAFPGCTHVIVNKNNQLVAQLCHIESVAHEKQRYNPNLTVSELNSHDNLMFMCLKHHLETNDEQLFTVSVMKQMKYDHENDYVMCPYHIDMSHLFALKKETENYWEKVERLKSKNPALTVINSHAAYEQLSADVGGILDFMETQINAFDQLTKQNYSDLFEIEIPNALAKMRILMNHMLIKYLESHVINNPQDMQSQAELERLRTVFLLPVWNTKA